MSKNLVIVESPAKERTIRKFLGEEYIVRSTFGHIRDLPARSMGVDEKDGFTPQYVLLPKAKQVLPALKADVKKVDRVYLATDYDREGEAIAWHVVEAASIPPKKVARITFHEITPDAIREALAKPRKIDMDLVEAQLARRILDRLVGYKLSPLLWKKIQKGLSAGRVQSVALRLAVEREAEITAFQSQDYWTVRARFQADPSPFEAELVEISGQKVEQIKTLHLFADDYRVTTTLLTDRPAVEKLVETLRQCRYKVEKVLCKEAHRAPFPPFMTATLQQDASRRLGFSAVKAMVIAQQLYEGIHLGKEGSVGLITYMRTDSLHVAATAQAEARHFVGAQYGKPFLPATPRMYRTKSKSAQEAHEAIRPTSIRRAPASLKPFLSSDQFRLYELVWQRFLASQMADAVYDTVTIDIAAAPGTPGTGAPGTGPSKGLSPLPSPYLFRAHGRTVKFPGFLRVYDELGEQDTGAPGTGPSKGLSPLPSPSLSPSPQPLPQLKEKSALVLQDILSEPHKTEPPPRFNEASLIKMLERHGIGRPSTYAPILQTILQRGYVRMESRRLFPTPLGIRVTDLLKSHFPEIVDLRFTARVEERLDEVAKGEGEWPKVVRDFFDPLKVNLAKAEQAIATKPLQPKETGEKCPACGSPLLLRESRFGRYISCSQYPRCKHKVSLDAQGKKVVLEVTSYHCLRCQKPLVRRMGRRGPFLACSGYPECRYTLSVDKQGNPIYRPEPKVTDQKCEKCGKPMWLRVGKRGPFLACSGFPRCRNLKKAA